MGEAVDRTSVKYLCKLHEGQAHLICEALLFGWAEKHIEAAENLYNKHSSFFSPLDRFKFIVKKSSFVKKFGFYDESLDLLIKLEKEIMALLKDNTDPRVTPLGCKKQLFKVYRDQARLWALKREE
jgi:hypothetical protein